MTVTNQQPEELIRDAIVGAIKERQAAYRANPGAYTPGSPDRFLAPSVRVAKGTQVYDASGKLMGSVPVGKLRRVNKAAGTVPMAVYNASGQLIGLVDPAKLQAIDTNDDDDDDSGPQYSPEALAAQGRSVATQGQTVDKANRDLAAGLTVAAAVRKMAARPGFQRVQKQMAQNSPLDAEAVIRALGTLAQRARVQKGLNAVHADSLAVGTLALAKLPPAQQAVVRAKLARTTMESRRRLSGKLQDVVS
jgi:hypothetical protein